MQSLFYVKLRQAKKLLSLNVRLAFAGYAKVGNFSTFSHCWMESLFATLHFISFNKLPQEINCNTYIVLTENATQ